MPTRSKAKGIPASSLQFLRDLTKNNDREWFNANKSRFQVEYSGMAEFADELLDLMNGHDSIETPSGAKSLFRIYRDTRFSKDKTPYKNHFSGHFTRAGKSRRGGYYFHIEPGASFIAGGFWNPNPEDLKRIREEIAAEPAPLKKILNSKSFKETFVALQGDALKTAPKGFDKEHPEIKLIRMKQFIATRKFADKEVQDPNFAHAVNDTFQKMRPWLDYMSEVLTTDANGKSLI